MENFVDSETPSEILAVAAMEHGKSLVSCTPAEDPVREVRTQVHLP